MRRWILPLALVVLSFVPTADVAFAGPPCVPTRMPAIGPACQRADGLYEVFSDDGRRIGLVHGVDYAPADGGGAQVTPEMPACVENGNPTPDNELPTALSYYMVVIYAVASDRPDRYSTQAPLIRSYVQEAQGYVSESAAEVGRDVRLRVQCVGGQIRVWDVRLDTPRSSTDFASIKQSLAAGGFTDPRTKLWVWYDGPGSCGGCAGIGDVHDDSRLTPDNWNNGNGISTGLVLLPDVAVSFAQPNGFVLAHENAHNLGAVQLDAPNTSGAFHCNDGKDVMCYADGGSNSHYTEVFCSTSVYDCNHNDYFHPDRLDGSYLAGHWNIGHPFNRYIQGCYEAWGRLQAGTPGVFFSVPGINSRASDLPTGCRGHRYAVQAIPYDVFGPDRFVNDAPRAAPYDFDVCWWNGPVFLECDQTIVGGGWEDARVPDMASHYEVRLRAGAEVDYLFRVI